MERIRRSNLFDQSTVALSPDGRRLVYVASRDDDARQLYVRRLDQLEGKPIPGTENAHGPFFSPDGEWVAFFTPNELKRASLSSGAVVVVTDVKPTSSGGSWGSDGNILFTYEPPEGLSTIPFNGGKRKPITESKGSLGHHFPHPLPGHKGVLFTIMQSEAWGHTGIAVFSFETGLWRTLLEEGTHPHYLSSGYVVYALAGTLQAVPFDLDRLEISGNPVQLLDGVTTRFGADFSLSADGTLAYVPGEWGWPDRSLVWVDRNGKIVDNTCDPKNYWWPRISPDGQRVAVTINTRRKGSTDIWICELVRNNTLTRITTDPSWDYSSGLDPRWKSSDLFSHASVYARPDRESCRWDRYSRMAVAEETGYMASLLVARWFDPALHRGTSQHELLTSGSFPKMAVRLNHGYRLSRSRESPCFRPMVNGSRFSQTNRVKTRCSWVLSPTSDRNIGFRRTGELSLSGRQTERSSFIGTETK